MMPIGDDNTGRTRTPIVNYILIAINIIVFIFAQGMGSNEAFLMSYSTVPREILTGTDIVTGPLGASPEPVYLTILTSMFMHGSWMHLGGNMLYLWIFGDNLENVMGHVKYLVFYLLCGALASLAHVFASSILQSGLDIPSLGASGAISGVLGGYMVLFPKNQVRVFALRSIINVSALVALGIWIAMQVISWFGVIGQETGDGQGGGVAFAAHVGGFLAGIILVKFFASRQPAKV